MTAFLTVAALMTAIALGFILPTLLGKQRGGALQAQRDQVNLAVLRDQFRELDADLAVGTIDTTGYESARHELEQRVVEDVQPAKPMQAVDAGMRSRLRLQAIALGLFVVIGAAALYAYLGAPNGLDPAQVAAPNANAHDMSPLEATAMVERLAQRLKSEPDNADGWLMLGRSYSAMGRFAEASSAYAHLMTLVPGDAQLLTDYADVLGMAQGKNLQGEPEKLLVRALTIDPKNTMALALLGTAKFERHEYAAAIADWQKILALTPPDSEMARMRNG